MSSENRSTKLSSLARLGLSDLTEAEESLTELSDLLGIARTDILDGVERAADPDAALRAVIQIARRDASAVKAVIAADEARARLWALLGASQGFAQFFLRTPGELASLLTVVDSLPTLDELRTELYDAVGAHDGVASSGDNEQRRALRVRYRRLLARIALYDLMQPDAVAILPEVAACLADAAGAALDASLAVARAAVASGRPGSFPAEQVAATRLAIIGMGKTGARELNYVSDVDVIFVCASADEEVVSEARAVEIGTRLATLTMRGIDEVEIEPPLWEVDANLRPEGKQGALVRTLDSHVSYYQRWAKSWEFQALLKARSLAGDQELADEYVAAVHPMVWSSAARTDFVDNVQRMRERVTAHIPPDDVAYQLKLGPGGIRDIEFTVQLLQLVHGLADENIRQRGTLHALEALVSEGYISRADAATFEHDYRVLRVLEHRLQLRGLSRTHLMPRVDDERRVLARASGLADSADGVWELWEGVKREVREIHVRVFYRPLLSAVAALPEEGRSLSTEAARDRLAAIGFTDPAGALRHIGALTTGLSRKATIQRHLMPVMIGWFAEGVDPDYGLLAFRRISERLGDSHWFLGMLRDSSGAAESMTRLLSGSRYIGELMEGIPEAAAWLDRADKLEPRSGVALYEEAESIQSRHETIDTAMTAVRALRRRELLRTAMAAVLGTISIEQLAQALTTITEVTIQATLRAVWREVVPDDAQPMSFAIIAMGRFGGAELGFGSDADVLYVYEPNGVDDQRANEVAQLLVAEIRKHSADPRVPLELDADLRPEGRNGPIVRTLEAYAEYYGRWSVSWEAQALLRARGIAGGVELIEKFTALADTIRYPQEMDRQGIREIKRIKARVENERLPQGVDPTRHVKLGPGGLSDVEWLVQLLQLEHAHAVTGMRTTSTLGALNAAVDSGLLGDDDARRLSTSWLLASRLRSANTLLTGQTSDVLPADRKQLDGMARILEYPPGSATELEEAWLGTARRARRSFEKIFYG